MARAIGLYAGGVHALTEVAVRADGTVFQRWQEKDVRYGYRWTRWSATGEVLGENARASLPASRSAGFSMLRLTSGNSACMNDRAHWRNGRLLVRLPE